jgi:hypothetical protein
MRNCPFDKINAPSLFSSGTLLRNSGKGRGGARHPDSRLTDFYMKQRGTLP